MNWEVTSLSLILSAPPESEHTIPRRQETRGATVPEAEGPGDLSPPRGNHPSSRKALPLGFLEGPPPWVLLWGLRVAGTWGGGWAHSTNRRTIHPRAEEQPPSSGSQKEAPGSWLTCRQPPG